MNYELEYKLLNAANEILRAEIDSLTKQLGAQNGIVPKGGKPSTTR